eukprot:m.213972 g.213972  ORF g.213972 m.213972 type:complete len:216 (-) comp25575_c0_seq1:408-1055(-)
MDRGGGRDGRGSTADRSAHHTHGHGHGHEHHRDDHHRDRHRHHRRRDESDGDRRERHSESHADRQRARGTHSAGKARTSSAPRAPRLGSTGTASTASPPPKRRSNKEMIRGWSAMTPVQRAKAKVDFDLRKARAFDSDLQGKDDEAHWERFRFDRFAKPELSVTDLPSDDDEEPAVRWTLRQQDLPRALCLLGNEHSALPAAPPSPPWPPSPSPR